MVERSCHEVSNADDSVSLLFAVSYVRDTPSRLSEEHPSMPLARVQSMSRLHPFPSEQRPNHVAPFELDEELSGPKARSRTFQASEEALQSKIHPEGFLLSLRHPPSEPWIFRRFKKTQKLLAKSRAPSNISEKSSPKLARKQHSHEVSSPSTSLRARKRLIPGLPHPDTLRLQVFSTS